MNARAPAPRVPRRFWIGLIATVAYVALAGGVANLLTATFPQRDPAADLALGHLPILIPLIVTGVLFVRWAGWSGPVWRVRAAYETSPRRWWLLAIPVLSLAQAISVLATAPSQRWLVGAVLPLLLVVNFLVGFGEELYFRGIVRASLRAHHGETVTLLVTSLLFGLAHSLGSVLTGVPAGIIAFQVFATAVDGIVFYGGLLATGRLWVSIALHALTDFSLRIGGGLSTGPSANVDPGPVNIAIQTALWALAAGVVVSCVRRDVLDHRAARGAAAPG